MPRTPLPITGVNRDGATPFLPEVADTVNGNSVANDGETFVAIGNTGSVTRTLSVPFSITVDGQAITPRTYPVPAGATWLAGPFEPLWYGETLQLDPDSTDLQLRAYRFGSELAVAAPAAPSVPFTDGTTVVVAELDYPGVDVDMYALVVDTAATAATIDGDVLVVTV